MVLSRGAATVRAEGGVAVGPQTFKDVLRLWASGVSVVTMRRDGRVHGITISSFTSLSLEPPLVLICVERLASSHDAIVSAGCFAVNVLSAGQEGLSDRAAGRLGPAAGDLDDLPHRTEATGAPILEKALAWIDCSLHARHDGGDHGIFVGRVEAAGRAAGRPLLWFDRDYHRLAPRSRRPPARRRPR